MSKSDIILDIVKLLMRKFVERCWLLQFNVFFKAAFTKVSFKDMIAQAKEKAKTSWDDWGIEKRWEYFAIPFVLLLIRTINYVIANFLTLKRDSDVLNYQGESSPLTLIYQANALISSLNIWLMYLGAIIVALLIRKILIRWGASF